MTERERLLEKLGKVKALADRGEGGEKESAERTLAALMKGTGSPRRTWRTQRPPFTGSATKRTGSADCWDSWLICTWARAILSGAWVNTREDPEKSGDQVYSGPIHRDRGRFCLL